MPRMDKTFSRKMNMVEATEIQAEDDLDYYLGLSIPQRLAELEGRRGLLYDSQDGRVGSRVPGVRAVTVRPLGALPDDWGLRTGGLRVRSND